MEIDRLAEALIEEEKLLVELAAVFRGQREALVRSDPDAVDESVFAVRRIAGTLTEARRRRRILMEVVAGWEGAALRDLDDLLGERMTVQLIQARGALQTTAAELRREVDLNRTILHRLTRDGEALLATAAGGEGPERSADPVGAEPRSRSSASRRLLEQDADMAVLRDELVQGLDSPEGGCTQAGGDAEGVEPTGAAPSDAAPRDDGPAERGDARTGRESGGER